MIKASCDQAGFDIQDMPDPDIFTTITTRGTWDAALFGWSSSGLVASGESIYVTGGSQNYGGYTDPTVDSSWAEVIKTVDRQKADQLKVPMEEALWSNPYNATLYATPNLVRVGVHPAGPGGQPDPDRHHLERRDLDQERLIPAIGRRRPPPPATGPHNTTSTA